MVLGESTSSRGDSRDLCVLLEIEPAPGSSCPLSDFDGQISEVRQQLTGTQCLTDTTLQSGEGCGSSDQDSTEVVYSTSEVKLTCPCTVFGEFDCVPQLVDVVDGRLIVETYLSDRTRLANLVEALKKISGELRLRQLKRIDTSDAERCGKTVTLDLYDITEKQRDAVACAVARGYYSSPREVSIEELADEFGISISAMSQRLKAVESKLATSAFTSR